MTEVSREAEAGKSQLHLHVVREVRSWQDYREAVSAHVELSRVLEQFNNPKALRESGLAPLIFEAQRTGIERQMALLREKMALFEVRHPETTE